MCQVYPVVKVSSTPENLLQSWTGILVYKETKGLKTQITRCSSSIPFHYKSNPQVFNKHILKIIPDSFNFEWCDSKWVPEEK